MSDMRLINEIAYQERLAKIPMEERTFRKAVEIAEDMPTIDAVPVVRCKDCKWFAECVGKDSGKPCGYGQCTRPLCMRSLIGTDDFCSYGERKDSE